MATNEAVGRVSLPKLAGGVLAAVVLEKVWHRATGEDLPAPPTARRAASPVGARPAAGADKGPDKAPGKAPDKPTKLSGRAWWGVLKRTVKEFGNDNLTDWAAALTYYGVLSIFPGLLALVSVLGLLGESAIQPLLDSMKSIAPGQVGEILSNGARGLSGTEGSAGILVVVGLAGAIWSASGYVAAFMRASNAIYDVPEGRPIWKTLPIRLGVTIVVGVMLAVSAVIVVFTGDFADRVGNAIGMGSALLTVWGIAKWPVLILLISLVFAILYWASPNAKQGGFRWVSPGGLLAVFIWIIASAGFAFYVSKFGSYNQTYGTLGGVIVFFVWLWISNIAVLLGAEFDAELHRGRAIAAGQPEDKEPFVELRDTRKIDKDKDTDLK